MRIVGFGLRALSVCLLAAVLSCKREAPPSAGLLDNPLLKKLPESTLGFFVMDLSTPDYKRYAESPWAQDPAALAEKLNGLTPGAENPDAAKFMALAKDLIEASGVSKKEKGKSAAASGVIFVASDPQSPLQAGAALYVQGAPGEDLSRRVEAMTAVLKKHELNPTPADFRGTPGYTLQIKDAPTPLCFAADKTKLVLSTSQELGGALFGAETSNWIGQIKGTDRFKKAAGDLSARPGSIAFGFIDAEKILSLPAVAAAVQQAQSPLFAKVAPEALAIMQRMEQSPVVEYNLALKPAAQGSAAAGIKAAGTALAAKQLPGDTALMLTVDGALLAAAKEAGLEGLGDEEKAAAEKHLALLDSMSALTLGVRGAPAGTLFPEILLAGQAKEAEKLESSVKAVLGGLLESSGMPPAQWQEKEVAKAKTSFWYSPVGGLGLYIARTGDLVAVASWEGILGSFIGGAAGKEGTLGRASPALESEIEQDPPLALLYINFNKLGAMIEAAGGTLAMFTGGKPGMDLSQINELRKMGRMLFAVRYRDYVVQMDSRYEADM